MTQLIPDLRSFLVACPRLLGVVAIAPGFSSSSIPPQVRMALAVALSAAIAPLMAGSTAIRGMSWEAYGLLMVSELALGALIGFGLTCLLEAARLAGELVDLQIGFRAAELYDPTVGGSSSILGRLWYMCAIVFFFQVGGHHWLIAGLARSYELCPVGELVYQRQLGWLAAELLTTLFTLALQMAAPLVAALLMADLALGLVGRGMPQMNLLLVGMPAKILVGLGALALCAPGMGGVLGRIVTDFHHLLIRLLEAVH